MQLQLGGATAAAAAAWLCKPQNCIPTAYLVSFLTAAAVSATPSGCE